MRGSGERLHKKREKGREAAWREGRRRGGRLHGGKVEEEGCCIGERGDGIEERREQSLHWERGGEAGGTFLLLYSNR